MKTRGQVACQIQRATIHMPDWADSEWLKQPGAEHLITIRNKRGLRAPGMGKRCASRNERAWTRVYPARRLGPRGRRFD